MTSSICRYLHCGHGVLVWKLTNLEEDYVIYIEGQEGGHAHALLLI